MTDRNTTSRPMDRPIDRDQRTTRSSSESGVRHETRGAERETTGHAQREMGKATDDWSQRAKGAVRETAGKAERKLGEHERRS